jgi:homoserine kinase type II
MALITPWPLPEARRAGARFGLDIVAIEPLAAGSVNSNFRLRVAGGKQLFARIYEEQGEAGARAELSLLDALSAQGVPTVPALRQPDGEALARYRDKPVVFFPWVNGSQRCQAGVTADDTRRLGRALAELHCAQVECVPEGRFNPEDLYVRLDAIEGTKFSDAARLIRSELDRVLAERDVTLPRGLIHGDLFRDNVLWNEGGIVALLDFESAQAGVYAYDLMVCVHAWCFGDSFEPALVRELFAGYQEVRTLSAAERRGLKTEGGLAALRFATTRITDYSLRAPSGTPPTRDFARFLARLAALRKGRVALPE